MGVLLRVPVSGWLLVRQALACRPVGGCTWEAEPRLDCWWAEESQWGSHHIPQEGQRTAGNAVLRMRLARGVLRISGLGSASASALGR